MLYWRRIYVCIFTNADCIKKDLYIKCDQEDRIVEMDTPHTAIIESSICLPETPFGCAVDCRSRTCISRVDGSQVKVVVTFDLAGLSEVSHDGKDH